MLTNHIDDLITAAESMPSGLWKNRGLSHLRDALACFSMLDDKVPTQGLSTPQAGLGAVEASNADCVCKPGVRFADCPWHRIAR